METQKLKAI